MYNVQKCPFTQSVYRLNVSIAGVPLKSRISNRIDRGFDFDEIVMYTCMYYFAMLLLLGYIYFKYWGVWWSLGLGFVLSRMAGHRHRSSDIIITRLFNSAFFGLFELNNYTDNISAF
jgi:asparagine N-glycosylation enzyme membrane subunit Stt3